MSRVPPVTYLAPNVIALPVGAKPCLSSRAAVFDPVAVARDFPGLWAGFVVGNFASVEAAARAFGVSTRAAGKWFAGEGCHGARLVMAEAMEPGLTARFAQDLRRRAA